MGEITAYLRLNFRTVVFAKHRVLMGVYSNFLESDDVCNEL